jgi:hypothetical protein
MRELLDGKFAPITNTIGFLRYDSLRAAQSFFDWQSSIQSKRGVALASIEVCDELESVIPRLLPLTSVERRRYLFIPTQSDWVAFWDNGYRGSDVFAHLSFLAETLSCEAVRATYIPENGDKQFPALYGPTQSDFLNYVRSVAVAYDGKKWSFSAAGEVQDFENIERYSNRKIQERFTFEMLEEYLRALGIYAFDKKFYLPSGKCATRIEKVGPIAPTAREFQLADLQ